MEATNVVGTAAHSLAQRAWPGLLAPERLVPWKPPHVLLTAMEMGFASADSRQAFAAAERLSFELHRAGARDAALDACRVRLAFATSELRRGRGTPEPSLVRLGLQAAVDLIRINGCDGVLRIAIDGLAALERLADGESAMIFGLPVRLPAAGDDSAAASGISQFARSSLVVETSRMLLHRGVSGQRIMEVHRLCAKWPFLIEQGPVHAHELLSLHGLDWPGAGAGDRAADVAPVLRIIDRLRSLNVRATRGGGGVFEALALYEEREQRILGSGVRHARYLAALAETLFQYGQTAAAEVCFREAHDLAAVAEPDLANGIVRRWSSHPGRRAAVPPIITAVGPDPAQLLKLSALCATRFGATPSP